ncbi:MAG: DUF3875 domain-containing protein, partial [Chitinophagales bacterium]
MKNLQDILPIYSVEQDAILSKMGDITIGFRAELPEIFTMSSQDHESLHQAWIKAIKVLPANCILHKQDWFTEANYSADFSGELSFLERASERFFNERPYLDHSCYLFITRMPAGRVQPNSMFSTLLRKHIVPVETLDDKFFASLQECVGQFERILADSGLISLERMKDESLEEVISQYLNLGKDNLVRDISFGTGFESGIQVGEKYCALFTLADAVDLPAHCGSRIT